MSTVTPKNTSKKHQRRRYLLITLGVTFLVVIAAGTLQFAAFDTADECKWSNGIKVCLKVEKESYIIGDNIKLTAHITNMRPTAYSQSSNCLSSGISTYINGTNYDSLVPESCADAISTTRLEPREVIVEEKCIATAGRSSFGSLDDLFNPGISELYIKWRGHPSNTVHVQLSNATSTEDSYASCL